MRDKAKNLGVFQRKNNECNGGDGSFSEAFL